MEAEVPRWFQKAKSHKWRKIYRVLSADSASDTNLEEFTNANNKDTLHLLFAIDMLNEGLHIPDVGAVILLRPTESPIIFYQQIGRCMQVDTAHTPIIFDFVNNFKSIKANNFLKDLETCNEIQNARRNSFGLPQQSLNVRIIDETKEIVTLFENIAERIQPFEVGLEHMKNYANDYGHARAPHGHKTSSGFKLGLWMRSRRVEYKKGILPAEKVKALEALADWVWDPQEVYFQEGLEHLKQFAHAYGHAKVPHGHKTPCGFKLGPWVNSKRMQYKKGILSAERVKVLEALAGWVWDRVEAYFQEGLENLKQYVHEYGHANVLTNYKTSSGFTLGSWANSKCMQYKKGILPAEKMNALEEITDWVLDPEYADFQEGLDNLKQYVHENGHASVPTSYITSSGFKLGLWISSRRVEYKNMILSAGRTKALEAITGWNPDPKEADFQEGLENLKQYVHEHGHAKVPRSHKTPSGFKLGSWVILKRMQYKKGILSAEKIKAIEAVAGWVWDGVEAYFQEGLEHLLQYVHEFGHASVPRRYKTPSGYPLDTWVVARRAEYKKKGVLSAERIKVLEAIPGWVWDPYETYFQEGLEHLKQYVHEFAHASVPKKHKTPSGYPLGQWVNSKRMQYKKGILSAERVKAMEALADWIWDQQEVDFQEGLEHLKQYVHEFAHASIPKSYKTSSGFKLGLWIISRRVEYKKMRLSAERAKAMEAITGWVLNPEDVDDQEGLEHLKQYAHEFGHARLPRSHKTLSGFKLGSWVIRKRLEYKEGILSAEKIKAMEALSGWIWDPQEADFQEGLEHLKQYIHENGYVKVPWRHKTACGFTLGLWEESRRVEYKIGTLSTERIKAMEAITGWVWDPKETYFREGLEHLKQYVHEHGHAKVPRSHKTPSGFKLGSWVNSKRMEYKKGIMSAERVKAMEAISCWISICKKPV